jgi:hypothetical protein
LTSPFLVSGFQINKIGNKITLLMNILHHLLRK